MSIDDAQAKFKREKLAFNCKKEIVSYTNNKVNMCVFKKITYFLVCIFFVSCSGDGSIIEDGYPFNIIIDNSDIDEFADISDFMYHKKIVIKKDSLYPQIVDDFYATNDYLVLADRSYTGVLNCYDFDGNLLWRKKADDQEPFVFSSIGQIDVYEGDNKLEVFDDINSVFYYYDLVSGDYLGEERFGLDFNTKVKISPNLYAFSKFGIEAGEGDVWHDVSELFFVDSINYLGSQLRYDPRLNDRPLFIPDVDFVKTNTSLTYFRPFSDTLYEITGQEVSPIATLDFTQNSMPKAAQLDFRIANLFQFSISNSHPFVRSVCKSGAYLFIIYQYGDKGAFSIISGDGKIQTNSKLIVSQGRATGAPFLMKNSRMVSISSQSIDDLLTSHLNGAMRQEGNSNLVYKINNDKDDSNMIVNIFIPK